MKTALLSSLCILLTALPFAVAQGQITVDHVDGLSTEGRIISGAPVIFHLRFTNTTGSNIAGSTNGFRLYSADGAVWSPPVADSISINWSEMYDGGLYFNLFDADGTLSDTVGFGGYAVYKTGIPAGFDEVVFTISTQLSGAQQGLTLCLDSCFYRPVGYWFWAHAGSANSVPGWDGPHCYEVAGCCSGQAGDINGDGGSVPDITDLVFMVNYMFGGGPQPSCPEETDIDGSGGDVPDITDLVALVNYMFGGGAPPANCAR